MSAKEEADQHYKNAVAARKIEDAELALKEIEGALRVENRPEFFFEKAWAQLQLTDYDEAKNSLRMIGVINAFRPSELIVQEEVDQLHNQFADAQAKMKMVKSALNKAAKGKDPAAMLASIAQMPADEVKDLILPSVRLKYSKDDVTPGCSKIGGNPDLPTSYAWPRSAKGTALSFLCQIELSLLSGNASDGGKLLHFFFDNVEQLNENDPTQWRVALTEVAGSTNTEPPADISEDCLYKEQKLVGLPEQTFPDLCKLGRVALPALAFRLLYSDTLEKWYGKEPWHRHGGNTQDVQGETEPDTEGGWKLLLQLDSDLDLDMCLYVGGRLYFWILQSDFEARKFDDVRLFMQNT